MSIPAVVIVGAGPAGIRAAETLLAHGVTPCLIDEGLQAGGQIYRQQPSGFKRLSKALYGFESAKADALHRTAKQLESHIDYRPGTLVWSAGNGMLDLLQNQHLQRLAFDRLIIATGASDRILPVAGWTLPGVYTLGAAQIALKYQGCAIGDSIVFAGTGPLLYLVAYQYAKAGANVVAVLDRASFGRQARAVPGMMRQPATLAKGLYYRTWLATHGIPVHQEAKLLRVEGDRQAESVVWSNGRTEQCIACTALAFGYALRSETQLADLMGCEFLWSASNRAWLPRQDQAGRSSIETVYLAGDGASIRGADAAERAGQRVALAVLEDMDIAVDSSHAQRLEHEIARMDGFRQSLDKAFSFPIDWAAETPDEVIVCRCEEISVGELRAVVRHGATEMNRAKALCRVGMGRCQGRMCSAAAMEIIATESGRPIETVGRIRAQAPIKPLPFNVEAEQ